jgi:hypothetical protein
MLGMCFEANPGKNFHHAFEIEHQRGEKGWEQK